jgi:hypothetical protein
MAEMENGLTKQIDRSNNSRADLHLHTTYSDGALSPETLIRRAHAVELSIVSITDHDNVGGLDEAIEAGRSLGVEIVPGVELSVALNEKDIHLLAYFFDYNNQKLLDYLTFFRYERLKRAERIVQKLNDINVSLKMDAVLDQAGIGSVGRPHIASALLEEGLIETYHEAFLKYIGVGAPAYEKKYRRLKQHNLLLRPADLRSSRIPVNIPQILSYQPSLKLDWTGLKLSTHRIMKRVRNFTVALFINISY